MALRSPLYSSVRQFSTVRRIQVANPVVDLDGDEMTESFGD